LPGCTTWSKESWRAIQSLDNRENFDDRCGSMGVSRRMPDMIERRQERARNEAARIEARAIVERWENAGSVQRLTVRGQAD